VVAGGEFTLDGELEFAAALAHEFLREDGLAIDGEGEAAAVEVELIFDVALGGAEIEGELVFAGPRLAFACVGP
jgi:hypothetical protein